MSFALLFHYRKEIITAFLVILFYVLWFTIERQSDRIVNQKAEIKALTAEVETLHTEIAKVASDTAQIRLFFNKIETISAAERQELKTNEKTCENVTDFDSIIPRLNELFGYCEQ